MNNNFKLAPSILSADFSDLKNALKICKDGGAHWIHIDVMDNQFVPNLTIGPIVVKSLRKKTKKFLDVHMMVIQPEKLVEPFARSGADNITFHLEATDNPDAIIDLISSCGCKVGISIKPSTSIDTLYPYLDKIDGIQDRISKISMIMGITETSILNTSRILGIHKKARPILKNSLILEKGEVLDRNAEGWKEKGEKRESSQGWSARV